MDLLNNNKTPYFNYININDEPSSYLTDLFLNPYLIHSMPKNIFKFSDTDIIKLLSLDNIFKNVGVSYGRQLKSILNPKYGRYISIL